MAFRRWLLSRQCQLTLQLSCSLLITSLFTLWRPLFFPHACLTPVFVIVIVGSLAQDQHIGTRLQVSAWVLGPTWLAAILAGGLMTLAKLAGTDHPHGGSGAGYVAATAVLGLLGLALLVFLQAVAPPGPGRVMGIIAVLMYGIMVTLSVLYPTLSSMWVGAVLLVALGMFVAAVVGILVGWLVLPSLASDEVWRLTSEALQGAGAVLSYHSSLLMVDEQPGQPLHSKDSQSSHAATAQTAKHVGTAARSKAVLNPAHPAPQHKGGHHQLQQQQQQEHEWEFQRRQQTRHLRSSIEIAAAGAAVVAASQDAHKPAAEAAAVALSWIDAADSAVSAAASAAGDAAAAAAAASDASDAWSRHSSGYGTISGVGSDAIADAAAESSKRSVLQQQQQHEGVTQPLRVPRLSEQLLQEQQQQQEEEEETGSPGPRNIVDAWVSAAAAVSVTARRGSLPRPARVSEDGSSMTDLTDGLSSSVYHGQRKSLEGAASLDFMEEMDDTAFIQMMRVLSQSKGSAGTKPPAAATEKGAKPSNSITQLSGPAAAAGTGTILQSKSVGSALSALSVAGSSTAPADWARAVSPRKQRYQGTQDASAEADGLQDGPPSVAGAALAAASVAASVISSHGSILQQAAPQMPQLLPRKQQHSRFATGQKISLAHTQQPYTAGVGKRRSLGSRAWSFLTQRSWSSAAAGGRPPAAQSSCSSHGRAPAGEQTQQSSDSYCEGPLAWQGAAAAPRQLQPPTTSAELQPLIGRAKAALASARLEPRWLRPKGMHQLNVEACMQLLDDTELLLVRLSTLEGVSEERSLMGLQLHQLAHYKGIADALALIFAQLTAFIIDVASAVAKQETCHCETPPWRLSWPRGKAANGVPSNTRQPPQSSSMKRPGAAAAAGTSQPAVQRPSPFAAVAGAAGAGGVDVDAASVGMSVLLSGMERQGSMVSSYLWEKKTGWKTAREMLKREMDASLGSYWWSVRKASKSLPVKVPRSREVMILIFLWPICNGVLDACERMELSARQVLHPHTAKTQSTPPANTADAAKAAAAAGAGTAASRPALFIPLRWLYSAFPTAFGAASHAVHAKHRAEQPVTIKAATGSDTGQPGPAFSMQQWARRAGAALWHWSGLRAVWGWLERQQHWAGPLLQLVLVKPALLAVVKAITHDVPATLSSKQGIKAMLASRTFQAAMKLLLTTGSIMLMTILLMHYIPAVAHSVPIFGYAAAVLCCQARVEATVDQAARRVIGTILGACLGLATNSIADIFQEPFLLFACLAVASLVLGVLARPQRRTAIVLALLTLCAVSLCAYEAACCSAKGRLGPVEQFLARMASVVGACIWVALVNRLLLPWYTSDYALEQLAGALEQAASLFTQIYDSQLERMRLAELVAGQTQQEAPEALLVHDGAGPAAPNIDAVAMSADSSTHGKVQPDPPPAVQLAAREAAEAQLLVVLRQQVLGRLVAVQLSLAKESVSWRRGVLATPPLVLNVLGALNAIKEALTSQRLALAPFTRHGAASLGAEQPGPTSAAGTGSGMLHTMVHCYSLWALPLHPLWLEILRDVHELTAATAAVLRHPPHGAAARSIARATLLGKLGQLEQQRLELRHGWLDIRVKLHRAVHGGQSWVPTATESSSFWPTDSVHLFTFTYGVSRCLNAFAAAAQAVANNLGD